MELDFKVHTFGCKVNSYDSGLIEKRLSVGGFKLAVGEPRIHVLNTCAVTQEATLEAGRLARRLKARDPFCLVVATGCAAQVDTDALSAVKAIDIVVANSHKTDLHVILKRHYQGLLEARVFKSNIFKKEDTEPGGGQDSLHTRSFLKIQDGCNSFCTFCVIPFARGKSRSIPVRDLVRRVRELHASGVRETVLTGVHIGDYADGSKNLADLVRAMFNETEMPRFRLSSMEPPELTDEILELFKNERLCPHFHMSIQSAQTDVLHQMKRKYTAEDVERSLKAISARVPDAFVGMDVIAGFPTETAEQFEETFDRLSRLPWTRLHVFPYSRRPGTFAARFPTLASAELRERAARLRNLSDTRARELARLQIGRKKKILQLRSKGPVSVGISRDFWTVELSPSGENATVLSESEVLITGISVTNSAACPNLTGLMLA